MIRPQPTATPGAPVRLTIDTPMTLRTASELLLAGQPFFADGHDKIIDLAAVGQVDSSGLAVLLEWQRLCNAAGGKLSLSHVPENLRVLSDLYDLDVFQEVSAAVVDS
ncbi:MAG: STAS domain-containing protein [Zoogloeaceae bacterium]|jgi:phospholipid transport system transporter-binding protein|nr:STAS domain-containing protein [Zoogloeaceae bacterium]